MLELENQKDTRTKLDQNIEKNIGNKCVISLLKKGV